MEKNNNFEESNNPDSELQKLSEEVSKLMKRVNINVSSDTFKSLFKFVLNIPDDVKETKFFHDIQQLHEINLQYEDIIWLIKDFGIENHADALSRFLKSIDVNLDLHCYLKEIVLNDNISKREKVIILLAHMESLIYDTLNRSKKSRTNVKTLVTQISVDQNNGMSSKSIGKLFVLGITYVVFASTDNYTEHIDKRVPFRNDILHNGIILYTNKDIEMVYGLLIDFISMLVQIKNVADD